MSKKDYKKPSMKVEKDMMQESLMAISDEAMVNGLNVIDEEEKPLDFVIGGGCNKTIWDRCEKQHSAFRFLSRV